MSTTPKGLAEVSGTGLNMTHEEFEEVAKKLAERLSALAAENGGVLRFEA